MEWILNGTYVDRKSAMQILEIETDHKVDPVLRIVPCFTIGTAKIYLKEDILEAKRNLRAELVLLITGDEVWATRSMGVNTCCHFCKENIPRGTLFTNYQAKNEQTLKPYCQSCLRFTILKREEPEKEEISLNGARV